MEWEKQADIMREFLEHEPEYMLLHYINQLAGIMQGSKKEFQDVMARIHEESNGEVKAKSKLVRKEIERRTSNVD